jgi:hypothetical protein
MAGSRPSWCRVHGCPYANGNKQTFPVVANVLFLVVRGLGLRPACPSAAGPLLGRDRVILHQQDPARGILKQLGHQTKRKHQHRDIVKPALILFLDHSLALSLARSPIRLRAGDGRTPRSADARESILRRFYINIFAAATQQAECFTHIMIGFVLKFAVWLWSVDCEIVCLGVVKTADCFFRGSFTFEQIFLWKFRMLCSFDLTVTLLGVT